MSAFSKTWMPANAWPSSKRPFRRGSARRLRLSKVSRGYLRKEIEKVSQALDAPYEELLHRLPLEQVLNVDETGHKENGGKFWT